MSKMIDNLFENYKNVVLKGKQQVTEENLEEKQAERDKKQKLVEAEKLAEARKTRLGELASNLKYLPMVEEIIDMHYLADGIMVFARTLDGNAYEFIIRPAAYARGFKNYRKGSKTDK